MNAPESEDDALEQRLDAALLDYFSSRDAGEAVDRQLFFRRHPDLEPQLRELLAAADLIEEMAGPTLAELAIPPEVANVEAEPPPASIPPLPTVPERETDFSLDSMEPTIQFQGHDQVISLSNPARALSPDEETIARSAEKPFASSIPQFDRSLPPFDGISQPRDGAQRASPSETSQPILPCRFGEYVLERILGRGGMGVVYKAHQVQLDRTVAIKMIRSGCLAGDAEIERFYAEARSAARLSHPNIVSVYQCGEIDGHHFFSMDYIAGSDLARLVHQGRLDPKAAARYVRDVARTIDYAHSQGILHRDLKPANVLIDEEDQVVISDFGLAKLIGSDHGLTQSGAALGTPSYMSPEQAAGNSDEHGEATDVYAMGAILFTALTGRPPFQNTTVVQTILDVIHQPAPQTRDIRPDVPIDLDTIVAKCLQKRVSDRYPSAAALADELDRFLAGEPIEARPISAARRVGRWLANVPIIAALTGFPPGGATAAHRWFQRALIGIMGITLAASLFGYRIGEWWQANRMPSRISIAAGLPDGAYHALAEEISRRIEAKFEEPPRVITTEGSKDNLQRLMDRDVDLAILQGTSIRGRQLAVVAPLYYEAVHFIVRKSSGIRHFTDLPGRRVAMGLPESGTRQATLLICNNIRVPIEDMDIASVDWTALFEDSTIDAAFAVVKVGLPALSTLLSQDDFTLLPLPNVQAISLNEPNFRPFEIEQGSYAGLPQSFQTLATPAFLVARDDTPPRLVTEFLDAIYSPVEPIEGLIPAEKAAHWQGLPLHPAARKYFETILELP